jgi:hypothetical protein
MAAMIAMRIAIPANRRPGESRDAAFALHMAASLSVEDSAPIPQKH